MDRTRSKMTTAGKAGAPVRSFAALGPVVLLALIAGSASAQEVSNPDLFLKSLQAAHQAVAQYGIIEGTEDAERVQRIGYALVKASGYEDYPFTFAVVDMPIPNAFALPAGQIFVTRGMLDLGLNDDMLAALLGHEIAHVTLRHFLKTRKRATLLNVLSQLVAVGAIAASANNRRDAYVGPGGLVQYDNNPTANLAQGAMMASMVASELFLRGYSRENEDQSDEEGQRLAALAGFDPDGARQLMAKMQSRIPQTKSYGYWQTHPFFDERLQAAEARALGLKAEEPPAEAEVAAFREQSQKVLLDFIDTRGGKLAPPARVALKEAALPVWPQGTAAERLRLERLHALRKMEFENLPMSRNYGRLIAAYRAEVENVRELTPESPLLLKLTQEMGELRAAAEKQYPEAIAILDRGVYQTPFLESFIATYPESERSAKVALELGIAYSRMGRETEAVEMFLDAWQRAPDSEPATRARSGLKNLAPLLEQLGALEQLAKQERDTDLQELSAERLDDWVSKFESIENGAAYLERFPDGWYVETVTERVNKLAEDLYREMVLYQELGDSAKAIERANRILRNAPLSPAADRLGREMEKLSISPGP
ncbi:MAG: M48 family metalloprotease [Acidobacteriota bacterium]